MADKKKVVYIAGPITGVEEYWKPFEKAEDNLTALGYIPLSPARLPQGMSNAQYMRICFAMIDSADAVLVLTHRYSPGVGVEADYCNYIGKPVVMTSPDGTGSHLAYARLKQDLQEVLT